MALIRKIRADRGLDAIPTSLPLEGVPASSLAPGSEPRGPRRKKTSGIVPLALIYYHARRRSREYASLARPSTSANSGPRPVCWVFRALPCPGPLRRPADQNSPGTIAKLISVICGSASRLNRDDATHSLVLRVSVGLSARPGGDEREVGVFAVVPEAVNVRIVCFGWLTLSLSGTFRVLDTRAKKL